MGKSSGSDRKGRPGSSTGNSIIEKKIDRYVNLVTKGKTIPIEISSETISKGELFFNTLNRYNASNNKIKFLNDIKNELSKRELNHFLLDSEDVVVARYFLKNYNRFANINRGRKLPSTQKNKPVSKQPLKVRFQIGSNRANAKVKAVLGNNVTYYPSISKNHVYEVTAAEFEKLSNVKSLKIIKNFKPNDYLRPRKMGEKFFK